MHGRINVASVCHLVSGFLGALPTSHMLDPLKLSVSQPGEDTGVAGAVAHGDGRPLDNVRVGDEWRRARGGRQDRRAPAQGGQLLLSAAVCRCRGRKGLGRRASSAAARLGCWGLVRRGLPLVRAGRHRYCPGTTGAAQPKFCQLRRVDTLKFLIAMLVMVRESEVPNDIRGSECMALVQIAIHPVIRYVCLIRYKCRGE